MQFYGGVAVVHKDNVTIAPLDIAPYMTFECLDLTVKTNPRTSLSTIYRPRPSPKNGLNFNKFIDEFTAFLETKIPERGHLLISGDLTWLLKECLGGFFSAIVNVINRSLETGVMPHAFKQATVRPLLTKSRLNPEQLGNF